MSLTRIISLAHPEGWMYLLGMSNKWKWARRLLWGTIACLLLISGGAWFFHEFWYDLSMGEGPAGPEVSPALFEQPWTERQVLLMGIGDSITDGFGASEGHGFFDMLQSNPPDDTPAMQGLTLSAVLPNLEANNLAVSGSISLLHLEILRDLPAQDAETFGLVIMTSGGNDVIHNYGRTAPEEGAMYGATLAQAQPWIDNYRQRLHEMLDLIDGVFPGGSVVLLGNIYDPTDGVGGAWHLGFPEWPDGMATLNAYNQIIAEVAAQRENVYLVDIHTAFLGHGFYCKQFWRSHYDADDPHLWYYWNVEDPNDRGYDALRRLFLIKAAEAFQDQADLLRQIPAPASPPTI